MVMIVLNTAAGVPTGTLTFMDNSSTCPPGTSTTGQGAAFCLLANYSGAACPEVAGASVTNIQNAGVNPTGATGNFATGCLQMPQFTTYTPVISTHYITPVFSGDANFLGATDPVSTLFQALRSPELLIAASPSTLTVTSGSTASTTLTLTSVLGYGMWQGRAIERLQLPSDADLRQLAAARGVLIYLSHCDQLRSAVSSKFGTDPMHRNNCGGCALRAWDRPQ